MDDDRNKVWYLQHNQLFLDTSLDRVDGAQHLFTITLFPKRSTIFDHRDEDRLVYLIKRGTVRLTRLTADGKEVTLAILGAGDIFGEEAMFSGGRTTVAICMEETLVCTAKADDLFALVASDPTLAINVAKVVSDRLGDASAAMEDLAYANVADRIVNALARLAAEHGVVSPGGVLLNIRLTHNDIASMIGSTRETVSLELSRLQRSGRIGIDGHRFTLPLAEVEAAGSHVR